MRFLGPFVSGGWLKLLAIFGAARGKNIICLAIFGAVRGKSIVCLAIFGAARRKAQCVWRGLAMLYYILRHMRASIFIEAFARGSDAEPSRPPSSQSKAPSTQPNCPSIKNDTTATANLAKHGARNPRRQPTSVCQDTGNDTTTPGRSFKLCRRLCRPALKSPQITSNHLKSPHITHPADQPF